MTHPETKSRGGCLAVAIIAAVLLLPPAYVLSLGPAVWLCDRGYVSFNAVNAYAYPVDQIAERFPPVYEALVDYESAFSYSGAVSRRVIGRAAW